MKICKKEKINENGKSCTFSNNNIIIDLKNEKLKLKINNEGIIEKIIEIKDLIINNNKNEIFQINNKNEIDNNISEFKNKYKNDIDILTRIFIYYKEIREKEDILFKELNDENKNNIYIINNNWIEKYKLYFEYIELEKYLLKNDNILNIIKNKNYLSDDLIGNLIINLPLDYIKKIISKENIDKKIDKLSYKDYKNINNKELKYLYNFQIINQEIYGKLICNKYEIQDYVNKIECYFLGNKKILLFLDKRIYNIDEIGYINDENIFIPEYLLEYSQQDVISKNLNKFFLNTFLNFDNNKKEIEIKNDNDITICFCYQIQSLQDNKESSNNP